MLLSAQVRATRRTDMPLVRRRSGVSRAQALVETAMIFSVLILLLAGSTDVATLLNDHLNVVYAARQGARTGSVLGNDPASDCVVINAVRAAVANEPSLTLVDIIVYQSDANGQPASVGGVLQEDTYTGATTCTVALDAPTYTPNPSPTALQWQPSVRNNTAFYEDSLGVQIDYTVTTQFQFFGSSPISLSDRAVMPVEVTSVPTPAPGNKKGPGH